jgi:hypothetical protein
MAPTYQELGKRGLVSNEGSQGATVAVLQCEQCRYIHMCRLQQGTQLLEDSFLRFLGGEGL